MPHPFVIALLAAAAGNPSPTLARQRVAALDLATPGIDPTQGKALSTNLVAIIAADVTALGHDVVSSADINAMLSYEKQKDLVGCESDTACLAEIGGALGADLMLSGAVGKLGDSFNVSLVLVDIRTSSVRQRFHGTSGSEATLADTVRRGVAVLFDQPVPLFGTATLLIKTEPPGARIELDGKEVGLTPLTLDEVPAGDHAVIARLNGREGRATVRLYADKVERLTVELKAAHAIRVKIFSEPPEARVLLDGAEVGHTPLLLPDVAPGDHALRVELEGHLVHEAALHLGEEAYAASETSPIKVEVTLRRPWKPVAFPLTVALGALPDARRFGAGVAGYAEIGLGIGAGLELGFGATNPLAGTATLRYWFRGESFEVAPFVRGAAYRVVPAGTLRGAPGFGVSLAVSHATTLGRFGVRIEPSWSYDFGQTYTLPVALAAFWRI